ncbi:hypothetical protein C8R48DRAFT_594070 [Suillus tomentosus]|nr:hypothetical protein C8R48DRAFT_594070 [Suillus tomentosus]
MHTKISHSTIQSLNDGCNIRRLSSELEDHSLLVMALSQSDIPGLRNLLQTALKNGANIRAILQTIEDTLERGYRPRGYSQDTLDLSLLILCLGGRNLPSVNVSPSYHLELFIDTPYVSRLHRL